MNSKLLAVTLLALVLLPGRSPAQASGGLPPLREPQSAVRVVDLTGDGLLDVLLLHADGITVSLNCGGGRFKTGFEVPATQLPSLDPAQWIPLRVDDDGRLGVGLGPTRSVFEPLSPPAAATSAGNPGRPGPSLAPGPAPGTGSQVGTQTLGGGAQRSARPPAFPVHITTAALPAGEDGFPYAAALDAAGGTLPYAWMITAGSLPPGLTLHADGTLAGTLEGPGDYPIQVRVFDNAQACPGSDSAQLTLSVGIAPLAVVGETDFQLQSLELIILDALDPMAPYAAELDAQGGLRPYSWAAVPIDSASQSVLDQLVTTPNPSWGLPSALTVLLDGTISGWQMDVADALTLQVPFTGITLTGYVFSGEVVDSQRPGATDTGLFLIPTIPIGCP